MSAGLLALYSFGGEVNLYPLLFYGLKAMSNRGDRAVAYVYSKGSLKRLELDLSREDGRAVEGSAAIGCVHAEDCCEEVPEGAICAFGGRASIGGLGDAVYVALTRGGEVYAYRPPRLWHLAVGAHGFDFAIIATESAAVEVLGGEVRRSLKGGELLRVHRYGVEARGGGEPGEICAMELIYAARLDSEIDGVEVAEVRAELARRLAKKIGGAPDVVIGVPETGLYYASWTARELGAWHVPAFVATARARSALMDELKDRISAIQLKANVVEHDVRGKRVLVVDDSIISGLTLRQIALLLRLKAGAKEVKAAVASPPLRRACPYGVKTPPEDHMIFNYLNDGDVAKVLELDGLAYLSPDEVEEAAGRPICKLCFLSKKLNYKANSSDAQR